MRSIINLLRLLLGIVVAIVLMAGMPIYDEPFGGCITRGFATLERGCTLWLDVLLGFGIVFLVACVGPNSWRPQFWGFAIVIIVASMGGYAAFNTGIHLDIFWNPSIMVYYWKGAGVATVLGGLLGVGFHYLLLYIRSIIDRGRTQV